MLQKLCDDAPPGYFTLGWLMDHLHERSFGIVMLLFALVAIAPGISPVAGLLLAIPAFQMIVGQRAPVFPRRIAAHPLPTRYLTALIQRAIPALKYVERAIHPRWPTPLVATKRVVGIVVLLVGTLLVFIPIPLTNIPPALAIALISLAYLEQDGVLLSTALLAALILLAIASVAVWQMVVGAVWIGNH